MTYFIQFQVLLAIIVMVTRIGGSGDGLLDIGNSGDDQAFGYMVTFGFFFIVIVQTIGVFLDEEINFQVSWFTDERGG